MLVTAEFEKPGFGRGVRMATAPVLLSQGGIVSVVPYQLVPKTFLNVFADSKKLLRSEISLQFHDSFS